MNTPHRTEESRVFFRALGKHIGELRKGIGMTQAELARALNVSQQTAFSWELGDRRVSVLTLVKLARIFETSVEELTGLKMPIRSKRRLSPAGIRHAERYQTLSKTRQRFVGRLMDLLLQEQSALASK